MRNIFGMIVLLLSLASTTFGQTAGLGQYQDHFNKGLRQWTNSFKNFELAKFRRLDSPIANSF